MDGPMYSSNCWLFLPFIDSIYRTLYHKVWFGDVIWAFLCFYDIGFDLLQNKWTLLMLTSSFLLH
jgi:hypothetical protein